MDYLFKIDDSNDLICVMINDQQVDFKLAEIHSELPEFEEVEFLNNIHETSLISEEMIESALKWYKSTIMESKSLPIDKTNDYSNKIKDCYQILFELYKETKSLEIKKALIYLGTFAQDYPNNNTWGIRLDSVMLDPKDFNKDKNG